MQTEPLIRIQLVKDDAAYDPGDLLECGYQVVGVSPGDVQSVEASVLWYSEGKGDEDMAVHFFERRIPSLENQADVGARHRFTTRLPNSPLSYDGQIVKIHWCVRVRVFFRRGKDCCREHPFRLKQPPVARP